MPVYLNVCSECAHHVGDRTCAAFPARIPDDIWEGSSSHTSVRPDQAGQTTLLVRDRVALDYLVSIGRLQRSDAKVVE